MLIILFFQVNSWNFKLDIYVCVALIKKNSNRKFNFKWQFCLYDKEAFLGFLNSFQILFKKIIVRDNSNSHNISVMEVKGKVHESGEWHLVSLKKLFSDHSKCNVNVSIPCLISFSVNDCRVSFPLIITSQLSSILIHIFFS